MVIIKYCKKKLFTSMTYFLNKKVKESSPIKQTLVHIFGIGPSLAEFFCKKVGVKPSLKFSRLTSRQVTLLSDALTKDKDNLNQEELSRTIYENVLRLTHIRSYRGVRHKKGLPLRGQRTRTNSKTAKRNNKIQNRSR
jgi:small subunit ribosomal protein S13